MVDPIVIGGTGGSGTRVVARIVRLGGRYMGSELNASEDAMPLARFDWRWGLRYLTDGPTPAMHEELGAAINEHLADRPNDESWGWKHPHSYLLLPFLREQLPRMRFIHVIRDGRDVALSANQQQAQRYGQLLRRSAEPEALRSAAWWAWANVRAGEAEGELGNDYLLVRYEDLCLNPAAATCRIAEFSGGSGGGLSSEVVAPDSLGRWRDQPPGYIEEIEAICRDALQRFGYPPME